MPCLLKNNDEFPLIRSASARLWSLININIDKREMV